MKYLIVLFLATYSISISGQSIIGKWKTFDDKTKEQKSVIEIYESDGMYYGKIVEISIEDKSAICEKCKGDQRGMSLIGLMIIEDIIWDGDMFNGGSILDPESGKTYRCHLELTDNDKLKVRGFLGMSLFGRTQYWLRKNTKSPN